MKNIFNTCANPKTLIFPVLLLTSLFTGCAGMTPRQGSQLGAEVGGLFGVAAGAAILNGGHDGGHQGHYGRNYYRSNYRDGGNNWVNRLVGTQVMRSGRNIGAVLGEVGAAQGGVTQHQQTTYSTHLECDNYNRCVEVTDRSYTTRQSAPSYNGYGYGQ